MGSLYDASAYGVPDGYSLPYYTAAEFASIVTNTNPYLSDTQTPDLRVINTQLAPAYKAKNDTVELNADYQVTPTLTLTSETAYSVDSVYSLEDYNRFNTAPGAWSTTSGGAPELVTRAVHRWRFESLGAG